MLGRQWSNESFRGFPSSASPPGQSGSFDRVGGGKDDFGGTQTFDNPVSDRFALVGRPRGCGGEIESERHIGTDEGAQAEIAEEFARVIEPDLGATAIIAKGCRREPELMSKVGQERVGHRIAGA